MKIDLDLALLELEGRHNLSPLVEVESRARPIPGSGKEGRACPPFELERNRCLGPLVDPDGS